MSIFPLVSVHSLMPALHSFHRVETVSRTYEGTGIGLALTLELVKAIGGTLEVVSQFGKGSTFSVRLPRGSRHLDKSKITSTAIEPIELPPRAQYELSVVSEASSWPQRTPSVVSSSADITSPPLSAPASSVSSSTIEDPFLPSTLLNLSGSVVLLADDNDDLRRYIAGALAKAFKVVQVSNGQDALDYAIRNPGLGLIVSDVQMPRLDGPGLLRALRSNPSTALIPSEFPFLSLLRQPLELTHCIFSHIPISSRWSGSESRSFAARSGRLSRQCNFVLSRGIALIF